MGIGTPAITAPLWGIGTGLIGATMGIGIGLTGATMGIGISLTGATMGIGAGLTTAAGFMVTAGMGIAAGSQ